MTGTINGDLSVRAFADTARMPWSPSPSPSVWRKRVHLVGPAESGQVTSLVRYAPNSQFDAHDHPDGEEILVLEGVFSDEHGDWPAGSYLLNPEGFRHAPFSKDGCLLFVKLRQYPGSGRRHIAIDTTKIRWSRSPMPGVVQKVLYEQPDFLDVVQLERWNARTELPSVSYAHGAEIFVLEGEFEDEAGTYAAGSWLRMPARSQHHPSSTQGCKLYVKRSGFSYLLSAPGPE